jgi:hypothetical protein
MVPGRELSTLPEMVDVSCTPLSGNFFIPACYSYYLINGHLINILIEFDR